MCKIALLNLQLLLPKPLAKRLKGDIITVQGVFIKKDLVILLKVGSKMLLINLSLYIRNFQVKFYSSYKDPQVKLKYYWNVITNMVVNYLKDLSNMLATGA